jgi:hypothetical protein
MQQLVNSVYLPWFDISAGSLHKGLEYSNLIFLCDRVYSQFLADFDNHYARHYLRERSNLRCYLRIQGCMDVLLVFFLLGELNRYFGGLLLGGL